MSEPTSVSSPSYWWWVLAVLGGIVGGLIAWGLNKPKNRYVANSLLLVGVLSSVVYVLGLFGI